MVLDETKFTILIKIVTRRKHSSISSRWIGVFVSSTHVIYIYSAPNIQTGVGEGGGAVWIHVLGERHRKSVHVTFSGAIFSEMAVHRRMSARRYRPTWRQLHVNIPQQQQRDRVGAGGAVLLHFRLESEQHLQNRVSRESEHLSNNYNVVGVVLGNAGISRFCLLLSTQRNQNQYMNKW